MRRFAVALVHHPVVDRGGAVVTTAITNLDLHDISRSAHTFGATDFFVTHPVEAQRTLALRVREHWTTGSGARRIPDRSAAIGILRVVHTLAEAQEALGPDTETWVTSARRVAGPSATLAEARTRLRTGPPVLLVLGTGWGLAPEVIEAATLRLAPLESPREDGYNHLSVRAAAAILLDRLLGVA